MPDIGLLVTPTEPESLEQTGLPESMIEQLILKILYFRGELYGQDLSVAIGLRFSVIQDVVDMLKLRHMVVIKRSLGVGNVGAVLMLSEAGRERAREYLETNQYAGVAPVPVSQYVEIVRQQRQREGWLSREALAKAFRGLVVTERLLAQIGPAVASGNSFLLYGKPGDGKTALIEALAGLETSPIFLPHALECQGNIVQVFDPIYHHQITEEQPSALSIAVDRSYDRRWARCRRPFIVSGGELSMDMLDLRYNQTSRVYEAPFQLKANNGIYLIDDFGRQLARPAEVLNRWIVPMERRVDYLTFLTGGKMTVPFEAFLVFSTNLNPSELGDEAFLRRIQYKMLLHGPGENEIVRIFDSFCAARRIPCARDLVLRFVRKYYSDGKRTLRRCHPRDVITHALNLISFEKLPFQITSELLDRAFESCFVQDEPGQGIADSPVLPVMALSCADFWGDQVAQIQTAFGTLVFAASHRDRMSGSYREPDSERQYGETETERVLSRIHRQAFSSWLGLNLQQQLRDLTLYLAANEEDGARLSFDHRGVADQLTPANATGEDRVQFRQGLATALDSLSPLVPEARPEPVVEAPARLWKTA
jgi:hypothetical protein